MLLLLLLVRFFLSFTRFAVSPSSSSLSFCSSSRLSAFSFASLSSTDRRLHAHKNLYRTQCYHLLNIRSGDNSLTTPLLSKLHFQPHSFAIHQSIAHNSLPRFVHSCDRLQPDDFIVLIIYLLTYLLNSLFIFIYMLCMYLYVYIYIYIYIHSFIYMYIYV